MVKMQKMENYNANKKRLIIQDYNEKVIGNLKLRI